MRNLISFFFIIYATALWGIFPIAYQGRFHSHDVYTKSRLYDLYHRSEIKTLHLADFQEKKRDSTLWTLHRFGIASLDHAPLIYIHSAEIKDVLNLDNKSSRFSYNQVYQAIYQNALTARKIASIMVFSKSKEEKIKRLTELSSLSQGVWVEPDKHGVKVIAKPDIPPWKFLSEKQVIYQTLSKSAVDEIYDLVNKISFLSRLNQLPDKRLPPQEQLLKAGNDYKALPLKSKPGEWVSLRALRLDLPNFTPYPDSTYYQLQQAYLENNTKKLFNLLSKSYLQIAGTPYLEGYSKTLHYPTVRQLQAEKFLFKYPWILLCAALYGAAFLCYFFHTERLSLCFCIPAFIIHTGVLALRCYVLERPPVSNMFETVIYVPWVAMLAGLFLNVITNEKRLLFSACLVNLFLLVLLEATRLNSRLDNVQAVLDSQYWLIIHVLMVVGSYGLFLLAGVMGHIYLIAATVNKESVESMKSLGKQILHAIYLGTALLIPGTILGGVWAAESWGRFWDWDPKESWAFISSCVYLVWIHAFRFGHIRYFGLAIGAVTGLLSISFTWYGVNYILGTGLHSYGFGSGGEVYYYGYLLAEASFILSVVYIYTARVSKFEILALRKPHD